MPTFGAPMAYPRDPLARLGGLVDRGGPTLRRLRLRVMRWMIGAGYTPRLARGQEAAVAATLAAALPGLGAEEAARIARRHLESMYRVGTAWRVLRELDRPALLGFADRHLEVEGEARLETVARHHGPVILFSPHYGIPVLGCIHLVRRLAGRKRLNTFFAPPSENLSTVGYTELLSRLDPEVECIHSGPGATIRALRALRRGEALTMQPDVFDNRDGSALLVPFLHGLTYAMGGTAYLALRAGALVVPVFCHPARRGRFVLRVDPPIRYARTGDLDRDCYRLTAQIHRCMEAQIRHAPEHWLYWSTLPQRMLPGVAFPEAPGPSDWLGALATVARRAPASVPWVREVAEQLRGLAERPPPAGHPGAPA